MRFFKRHLARTSRMVVLLLVIEWFDEIIFGAQGAALPRIRADLHLSYEQIGLLLTLPPMLASWIFEPIMGLYGDTPLRRAIMLAGAVGMAASVLLMGVSSSFLLLMIAWIVFNPSSGALVGLAQATLMDLDPGRHEQNMARWTAAGSLGVVMGSLGVGVLLTTTLGWRVFFVAVGVLGIVITVWLWWMPWPALRGEDDDEEETYTLRQSVRRVLNALRQGEVVRWSLLLEASDLMLDTLFGFLALYFVDVVGVSAEQAAFAVGVWTTVGLVGDLAIIPLLERVSGLTYLRVTAVLQAILYSAFLLTPSFEVKLVLIGIIGFFNAGWYSILQANVYTALPNQSASILIIGNLFSVVHQVAPLLIGLAAARFGLGQAMAFPLIACAALFFGLPRRRGKVHAE